jgi:hypothetical protein
MDRFRTRSTLARIRRVLVWKWLDDASGDTVTIKGAGAVPKATRAEHVNPSANMAAVFGTCLYFSDFPHPTMVDI